MQTASMMVSLGKLGPVVQRHKVTPAEAAVYVHLHEKNNGTFPLSEAKLTADVQRSGAEERQRLSEMFDPKKLGKVFAGTAAKLPEKFSDVFVPEQLTAMGIVAAKPVAPLAQAQAQAPAPVKETPKA